jgi:cell division protein ZapA
VPQIDVTINGRKYPVGCDEGQEARLHRLASYIDAKVTELAGAAGPAGAVGEARLLVMASLLLADELADTAKEAERLRIEAQQAGRAAERKAADTEAAVASALEKVAARIEAIAVRLEST